MLRLRRLPPGLQLQALIQPPSRSPRARGRTLSSAPRDRRSKASLLAQISFGRCCSSGRHCPLAPLTRSCFGSPRPGRSLLLPTVPAASASRRIGSSSMAAAQRGARTPEVNGEQPSPSRTRDAGKSWRFAAASSAALAFPSRSRSDLQYGQLRRRLADRPSVFSGVAVAMCPAQFHELLSQWRRPALPRPREHSSGDIGDYWPAATSSPSTQRQYGKDLLEPISATAGRWRCHRRPQFPRSTERGWRGSGRNGPCPQRAGLRARH